MSYKLSYLCDEDRGREDDGEAPDEDETAAAVGHRAQGPRPHRKDDHDEPGRGFESRSTPISNIRFSLRSAKN